MGGMLTLFMRWHSAHGAWALLVVAICAGLIAHAETVARNVERLETEGVEVAARVTDRERRGTSQGWNSRSWHLSYVFATATGEEVRGRSEVAPSLYNATQVGRTVTVVYWPENPLLNEVSTGFRRGVGQARLLYGVATLLAGLAFAGRTTLLALAATRARDRGERARATVVDAAPVNKSATRWPKYRVVWTFTDRGGVARMGRSFPRREAEARKWPKGAMIDVVYAPERPDRSWWVEDVGPRGG